MVDIPTPSVDNSVANSLGVLPPNQTQSLPVQPEDTPAPESQQSGLLGRTLNIAKAPEQIMGHALGRVVSGLAGSHNEYSVDPNTGETTATPVKDSPGQTFRSILALGLMGAQGIGPKQGEMNFSQGLLAGLGGGAREAQARKDQLDQQARAKAQQDYANRLKAEEASRQQRQLTLNEQLNRAQIANFNNEQTARKMVMDQQAYNFKKEQATDSAAPYLQMAQLRVQADAPKVQGFKDLQIDPIATVSEGELGKYIDDNPGHASQYMALQTGVRQIYDPNSGTMKTEDLYSIYPSQTKVSPGLLKGLESVGAADKNNRLHGLYDTLSRAQKSDADVPVGTILTGYRQFTDWNKIQKDAEDVRLKEAQIQHERTSTWLEGLDAQLKQFGINDAKDQETARNLFRKYYDESNHTLLPQAAIDLNPDAVKPDGKPLYPTQKQKDAVRKNAELLEGALDSMYEVGMKDGFDKNKFVRDGNGNVQSTDQSSGYTLDMIGGYGRASGLLSNGFKTPTSPTQPGQVGGGESQLFQKYSTGLNPMASKVLQITATKFPSGTDLNNAIEFVQNAPITPDFTADDKIAVLDKLTGYYQELQGSQQAASQQQQDQTQRVQQRVNQIKTENRATDIIGQGAGIAQSD